MLQVTFTMSQADLAIELAYLFVRFYDAHYPGVVLKKKDVLLTTSELNEKLYDLY